MSGTSILLSDVRLRGKVLGTGAYGSVYHGRWRGIDVAVKRLHPVLAGEGEARTVFYHQFMAEIEKLASLRHRHILQYFGVTDVDSDNMPGIVTEMLGQTLRERYKEAPHLTVSEQLTVAAGVTAGLCYLHHPQINIVHRDLTTNNIMVTERGGCYAKITDIGGAKKMSRQGGVEGMTRCPGNQTYMAPEALEIAEEEHIGESVAQAEYGRGIDIFAFGISMMSMVNHREPSIYALGARRREEDFIELADHILSGLIVKCTSEHAESRPSADVLCDAIEDMLAKHSADHAATGAAAMTAERPNTLMMANSKGVKHLKAELEQANHVLKERAIRLKEMGRVLAEKDQEIQRQQAEIVHLRGRLEEATSAQSMAEADRLQAMRRHSDAGEGGAATGSQDQQTAAAVLSSQQERACMALYSALHQSLGTSLFAKKPTTKAKALEQAATAVMVLTGSPLSSERATLPKWRKVGNLPDGLTGYSPPANVAGRIVLKGIRDAASVDMLYESEAHDIHTWQASSLPWHGGVDSRFFHHRNHLYYLCTHHSGYDGPVIWRQQLAGEGARTHVARLTQPRVGYGAVLTDDSIIIVGGHVHDQRGTESPVLVVECVSLSTFELSTLPSVPRWLVTPQLVHHSRKIHAIGGGYSHENLKRFLTLDLERLAQGWSATDLPEAPYSCCALQTVNNHIIMAGGMASDTETVAKVFVLDTVARQWKQLPPLQHASRGSRLLFVNGKLLHFSGEQFHGGKWRLPQEIEMLEI